MHNFEKQTLNTQKSKLSCSPRYPDNQIPSGLDNLMYFFFCTTVIPIDLLFASCLGFGEHVSSEEQWDEK